MERIKLSRRLPGSRGVRLGWRWLQHVARSFSRSARLNRMYDECTIRIMASVLNKDSNCVDVGCHTGNILRKMIEFAPRGIHHAFEPIPELAAQLRQEFPGVKVFEVALSSTSGKAPFRHVVSRPAYSGLREREYPGRDEEIEMIDVKTEKLDVILSGQLKVDFMKVDVEGAELQVFHGAIQTITTDKPFIVFEHGLGAAEYYGTRPEAVYDLLVEQCGLAISLLPRWLQQGPALDREGFIGEFDARSNFYFLAHP